MKKFFLLPLLLLAFACNNTDKSAGESTTSENDIDAARNFLGAAKDGDFRKATSYMLQDSTNMQYLNLAEIAYNKSEPGKKRELREATIHLYDKQKLNDSVTIITYNNSAEKTKGHIKIIRQNDTWLADLKYYFDHAKDTVPGASKIDTISK